MSAFRKHIESPESALRAVLSAAIEKPVSLDLSELSEADKKEIALLLVASIDALDTFQEHLETCRLEDAFHAAFINSDSYESLLKQEKIIAGYFEREQKHQIAISGISDIVRRVTQFTTIVESTNFVPDIASRLNLHASMIDRIGIRHQSLTDTLESATRHFNQLESASKRLTDLPNLRFDFGIKISTIAEMQTIASPIPKIFEQFNSVATHLRTFDLSDIVFNNTNAAIESASATVQAVNRFFGNSRRPDFQYARSEITEAEIEDDINEAEVAELEARYLLHEESSDLILVGNDAVDLITEQIKECVDSVVEKRLQKFKPLLERIELLANPNSFTEVLHDFSVLVSREHWKQFWRVKGSKFVPCPEAVANSLLSMYLGGRWHGTAFVGNELANGDGFMDIVVNFLGINSVVELKMVGAGWGIGYAESGIAQLDQYMANYDEEEAYLVVFDGRKTRSGRKLAERYDRTNGTINVVNIPIYFEPPTRK